MDNSRTAVTLPHLLPMLAASSAPFDDPACRFETKWDGVRAMASVANGGLRLWGREGTDYTERYPELVVLRHLPAGTMLDGELVLIRDGRADFHALMSRHRRRPRRTPFLAQPVRYVMFDMLYYRGRCLTGQPFEERLHLLHTRLPELPCVALCEGVIGEGRATFEAAIAAGHEGVVAKRLASRYLSNQRGWKKIKQVMELPCVVIGYRTGPDGLRDLVMAALINGVLRYVGVVELGIHGKAALLRQLEVLGRKRPYVRCSLSARWVEPKLFCTVRFAGWRPGGAWRDAVLVEWAD